MKSYTPIDCNLYDQLELWSMRKQSCSIIYLKENIQTTTVAKIITLQTIDKEEFLVLEDDSKIRLDRIVKINDIIFGQSCNN